MRSSLSKAVEEYYALVDAGEPRHSAAVKVASSNSLLSDQIDRFCQTLNRAAVNTTRLNGGDLVDRLSNPGVLAVDAVREGVFGRKTAGCSTSMQQLSRVLTSMEASEKEQLATVEKLASAPPAEEPLVLLDGGIHGLYARLSPLEVQTTKLAFIKEINHRCRTAIKAEQNSEITVRATRDRLAKHPDRQELIKHASLYASRYEPELVPMVNYMASNLGVDIDAKTASLPTLWHADLTGATGLVAILRRCVESVKVASASLREHFPKIVETKMRLSLLVNTAAGSVPKTAMILDSSYADLQENQIQKVAAMAGSFMGSMLGSQGAAVPKPGLQNDPGVQSFTLQLRNPQHEATLRATRAKASLQALLADDDVLKAYEPAKVVDAFNELSQHTPSATENKAWLRATLRQMLQNNISVYDLQQFRGLERKGG